MPSRRRCPALTPTQTQWSPFEAKTNHSLMLRCETVMDTLAVQCKCCCKYKIIFIYSLCILLCFECLVLPQNIIYSHCLVLVLSYKTWILSIFQNNATFCRVKEKLGCSKFFLPASSTFLTWKPETLNLTHDTVHSGHLWVYTTCELEQCVQFHYVVLRT